METTHAHARRRDLLVEDCGFFEESIPDLKVECPSLTTLINTIVAKPLELEGMAAEYDVFTVSGAGPFDFAKVTRDHADYFPTAQFRGLRGLRGLVEGAKRNPGVKV